MQNTRSHIVNVSFNLFMQKNFKDVTMKEIVEKSGLSKGAFYHYFDSKAQIFNEITETYYLGTQQNIYHGMKKDSLYEFYHEYINRLKMMISKIRNITNDNNGNINDFNFFSLAFDAIRLVPGFKEKMKKAHDEEFNHWKEVITTARENGEIESYMTDGQIAHLFIYTNDGAGLHLIMEGKIDQVDQELLSLWDNLYLQIKMH
ncbi:MAG: TetR/AcrR family transcriptional regulator [Candidatus Cyclobacteriaceae bacterium M3_2C_046]